METRDLDRIRFVTRHFNDLQGLRYWVPLGLITLSAGGTPYFDNRRFVILRAALFVGAFLLMLIARRYYRNTFGEVERPPVLPAAEPATLSIYSPAGPPRLASSSGISPVVQRFLFIMGLALSLYWILQATGPAMQIYVQESMVRPPWFVPGTVFSFRSNGADFPIAPSTSKALFAQIMYVLYGSFFLGVWLWRERRLSQSHYLALGVLLLGLSVLGATLGYFVRHDFVAAMSMIPPKASLAVTRLWMGVLLCGASMVLVGLVDHGQLVWALRRRPASREEDGR